MIFCVCDCESSDLPKPDLPADDPSQPWIVSLAAQLRDEDGAMLGFFKTRIRAEGRIVRPGAEAVHGISSRAAARAGVSEVAALGLLIGFAAQATHVICHGAQFERTVIANNLARMGKSTEIWLRPRLQFVCTMLAATPFCKLPGKSDGGNFKWPSLDEACEILINMPGREGAHDEWDDCERAWKLFVALRERGAFELTA